MSEGWPHFVVVNILLFKNTRLKYYFQWLVFHHLGYHYFFTFEHYNLLNAFYPMNEENKFSFSMCINNHPQNKGSLWKKFDGLQPRNPPVL